MHADTTRRPSRRARCSALLLASTLLGGSALAQADCPVQPTDEGVVVLFMEAVPPEGAWVEETSNAGYTGTSYYRWSGPNHFGSPGNGVIEYQFEVHQAGNYQLRFYNYHDHPDSTEENDCWLRMDGQGPWMKTYSNGSGTVSTWNWTTRFDVDGPHPNANYDLSVGEHTLQVSGRSHDFCLDRIHLYIAPNSHGTDQGLPASVCDNPTPDGNYCTAALNSTGYGATMNWLGSTSIGNSDLTLVTRPVPDQPGLFFYGRDPIETPFGDGFLCVGAPIYRLGVAQPMNNILNWRVEQDELPDLGVMDPGDVLLAEDTTGRGHSSRVLKGGMCAVVRIDP